MTPDDPPGRRVLILQGWRPWHRSRSRSDELLDGNGLWLVNQVCDLVQAGTGRAGTTIRLHTRLNGHSPRRLASRQTH